MNAHRYSLPSLVQCTVRERSWASMQAASQAPSTTGFGQKAFFGRGIWLSIPVPGPRGLLTTPVRGELVWRLPCSTGAMSAPIVSLI